MKRGILAVLVSGCLAACNDTSGTRQISRDQTVDTAFRDWLGKHGLSVAGLRDTFAEKADSLWDYAIPLARIDSLYAWYPSSDSSYYLLTNIDPKTGKSLFREGDDTEYRFLDTKAKKVHIGVTLLNEGLLEPVDIFWQGPHTIFLLEKHKTANEHKLLKLDMQADSIWSYRVFSDHNP